VKTITSMFERTARATAIVVSVSSIAIGALATSSLPAAAANASAKGESITGTASSPQTWNKLLAEAGADHQVAIIVALNAAAVPEGHLGQSAKAGQRAGIKARRDAVVKQLKGTGAKQVRGVDEVPFMSMLADRHTLEVLRASRDVLGVGEDVALPLPEDVSSKAGASPAGTTSNEALPNGWDITRIQANVAQKNGWTGAGQTVAVLDTGVQRDHPNLAGKVVDESCFSHTGCPNGYNYEYGAGSAGAAAPCTYVVECGHGTHVAGTAAGRYTGVATGANVIAIQVFSKLVKDNQYAPLSYTTDQIYGLWWVYQLRNTYAIASVNLSIGSGAYSAPCDQLVDNEAQSSIYAWAKTLRSVGIATVVSAGNDNNSKALSTPACNSDVVSVGATSLDAYGQDAVYSGAYPGWGSNSDAYLSLLAPGVAINSSLPVNRYEAWGGTSMAAPHVTGAFAVLKQYQPARTVDDRQRALTSSGTTVYDTRNGVSKQRIDVMQALWWLYYNR
jgi:subtilisin